MEITEDAQRRELIFIIMKSLQGQNYNETVHKLEQESGYFFNMEYFEDRVKAGEWDKVERYLSGYTKLEDNEYSMEIFFVIRRQKYLEALDRHDWAKAIEILLKELKVFESFKEKIFEEITQLLSLENFREHEQFSMYGDMESARVMMLPELKQLIQANPLFCGKLEFPFFEGSLLTTLINQSLSWQHQCCKHPSANPEIKTLFADHPCGPANGAAHVPPPTNSPLQLEPSPKSGASPEIGAHSPFEPIVSRPASAFAGLMSNVNLLSPDAAVAVAPPGLLEPPSAAAFLKTLRPPTSAPGVDYQAADAEHLTRTVHMGQPDELPIVNASGTVTNVSGPIVASLDRISPPVSLSNMMSARILSPAKSASIDSNRTSKQADIVDSAQIRALRLPDLPTIVKVVRLIYTKSGASLLALDENGSHKLWKLRCHDRNPSEESAASISLPRWLPSIGTPVTNDTGKTDSAEQPAACIALSKNDSYLLSLSGGKVSLFNIMSFKVWTNFTVPHSTATFLAFHPEDNNIFVIGMDDSTIQIYHVRTDKVVKELRGHQKRITGLAFSKSLNVLVSSGADAQLCVWSIDGWEKMKYRSIKPPVGRPSLTGETEIQFHKDQMHLLVVNEMLMAIYDSELECLHMWSPRGPRCLAVITGAVYSCDGLLVYAGLSHGKVGMFDADCLRLRCFIEPSAYIPDSVTMYDGDEFCSIFPEAIAAHPSEPNQIALGMSNGAIYVIEPSDAEAKWGAPPQENDETLPLPPPPNSTHQEASEAPLQGAEMMTTGSQESRFDTAAYSPSFSLGRTHQ